MPNPPMINRTVKKLTARGVRKIKLKPVISTVVILALLIATNLFLPQLTMAMLGLQRVDLPKIGYGTKIFDRRDKLVCTIYGDDQRDQEPVPLTSVSENMQHAFMAAEDHDFYDHDGINPLSFVRAVIVDLSAHRGLQGGSTISEQLVKNLCFQDQPRTLYIKVAEILMALEMEQRYSKQQILEAYCNAVYFGDGVFGVKRAAEHYFGKEPERLNIAESAYLAGLVNAPSMLSQNKKAAIEREHLILDSMERLHYATHAQVMAAKHAALPLRTAAIGWRRYRYYTTEVLKQLHRDLPDSVFNKGLNVYTFMDPAAQALAERSLQTGIKHAPAGINQGALVSISVADGGVLSIVGGAGSYSQNQWNRALSPHTAGSAFKPFVYLTALESGALSPDALVDDSPLDVNQPGAPTYSPHNYDGKFLGPITIRKALALSRNIPAVRIAQQVGPDAIIHTAHSAGIQSKLDDNLSLALGSSAVTPLEMAAAYGTLARDGVYIAPSMVRKVTDAQGNVLKSYTAEQQQVFDPEPVAELLGALQDVVQKGTGVRARLFDRPVAGKTGTADGAKDLWFIGFTPDVVTAVWGGNDQNKAVHSNASGSLMAGIWQQYMRGYYQEHTVAPGEFAIAEHPLMDEPDPIHILPQPAGIFQRLFGGLWEAPQPVDRRYVTDRQDAAPPPPPPAAHKKKGWFKRFLNWFD